MEDTIITYLERALLVGCPAAGLKLQVLVERDSEGPPPPETPISDAVPDVVVFVIDVKSSAGSLMPKAKGDRVTDPGVILGSSSMSIFFT